MVIPDQPTILTFQRYKTLYVYLFLIDQLLLSKILLYIVVEYSTQHRLPSQLPITTR